MYPPDLKYTQDHEWIRLTGQSGQVGDHALRSGAAW